MTSCTEALSGTPAPINQHAARLEQHNLKLNTVLLHALLRWSQLPMQSSTRPNPLAECTNRKQFEGYRTQTKTGMIWVMNKLLSGRGYCTEMQA